MKPDAERQQRISEIAAFYEGDRSIWLRDPRRDVLLLLSYLNDIADASEPDTALREQEWRKHVEAKLRNSTCWRVEQGMHGACPSEASMDAWCFTCWAHEAANLLASYDAAKCTPK